MHEVTPAKSTPERDPTQKQGTAPENAEREGMSEGVLPGVQLATPPPSDNPRTKLQPQQLLHLQRTRGNQFVMRYLQQDSAPATTPPAADATSETAAPAASSPDATEQPKSTDSASKNGEKAAPAAAQTPADETAPVGSPAEEIAPLLEMLPAPQVPPAFQNEMSIPLPGAENMAALATPASSDIALMPETSGASDSPAMPAAMNPLPESAPPSGIQASFEMPAELMAPPPVFAAPLATHMPAPSAPPIQRQEEGDDDSGGILGGIRSRLNSVVSGLRSGWSSLSETAQSAFGGLQERVSGIGSTLGSMASGALETVQSGWESVRQTASSLTDSLQSRLTAGATAVTNMARNLANAVKNIDPDALQSAWSSITGFMGGVWDGVQNQARSAMTGLGNLWAGLQGRFSGLLAGLGNQARSLMGGLSSAADAITTRLQSGWTSLQQRASQMSGVVGSVMSALRSVVDRLLSAGRQAWNGIQSMWSGLQSRFSGMWERVRSAASSLWDGIRQRASSAWDTIGNAWSGVRSWVGKQVGRLVGGLSSVWGRIKSFSIGRLVEVLTKAVPFVQAIRQALADPEGTAMPIVQPIADQLQAQLPGKSEQEGHQKISEFSSSGSISPPQIGAGATAGGTVQRSLASRGSSSANIVRRTPERTTAGFGEVWDGFYHAMSEKLAGLDVLKAVKDALFTLIWPFPAAEHEFDEMFKEVGNRVDRLFSPRGLSEPLNMLKDLISNLSHLVDIPMIIIRRLTNVGMHFMGWITIASVLVGAGLGAVAGGLGGTAIGGIAGGILGFGAGAAPGAAVGGVGGAATGAWAGAGAGLAAATSIGIGLLVIFAGAQIFSIQKALADLFGAPQTKDEKDDDYNQLADSLIGLVVTAILAGVLWLASKVAGAIMGLLRRVVARLRGKQPPPPPPPPPDAPPAADRPAYNPRGRTNAELQGDVDPAPRAGETPADAQARVRAAQEEILLRETMGRYEALGEHPDHVDMRAHDTANAADGAHTIERHGPDIPLRRADAPPGARTIEGRMYGDPPWGGDTNFSARWMSEDLMNQTVNRFLRQNWETIRSDLAQNGRFETTFRADGIIGEGFWNRNFGRPGPTDPVYIRTNLVKITIEYAPGKVPPFNIIRTFPNIPGT